MEKNLKRKRWFLFFLLLLFLFFLLIFSPSEEKLDWVVKLVYVHGGLVWSSLLLFAFSLFLTLISFFKEEFFSWAKGGVFSAYIFWWLYFLSSLLVAYFAWGGVNWGEPRLRIAVEVLFLSSLFLLLALNIEREFWQKFLYILTSLGTWALWLTRTSVLHPNQPIRRSPSFELKLFAILIFIDIFILSLLTAFYFLRGERDESG